MQHLPDLARIFGHVLLEARKAVPGLSQEKLAEAVGLERAYISRLERGLALPTLTVLFLLANKLNLSVTALVSRVEQRFVSKVSSIKAPSSNSPGPKQQ